MWLHWWQANQLMWPPHPLSYWTDIATFSFNMFVSTWFTTTAKKTFYLTHVLWCLDTRLEEAGQVLISVSDFLLPHQHYCLWWLKHCKILRIIPGNTVSTFFSPLGINSSSEKRRQRVPNVGVAAEMSLSFHNAEMCLMWVNEKKRVCEFKGSFSSDYVFTERHTYSHIVFHIHMEPVMKLWCIKKKPQIFKCGFCMSAHRCMPAIPNNVVF